MHSPRCEPQQIYVQTDSILYPKFFFFLTRYFGGRRGYMYKTGTRLFEYLSPIARFSKYFSHNVFYKAKNWHTLSLE